MNVQFHFHPEMWFLVPTICVGEMACECCGEEAGFAIGAEFLSFGMSVGFFDHHDPEVQP